MTLRERLAMQEQELYINEISKGEIEDMAQEDSSGNVVPLRSNEVVTMDLVPSFAISLSEAQERNKMLQEYVEKMLKSGIDYGIISGSQKPSLYRSGAEKLIQAYGLSKQVSVVNRTECWDQGLFNYEVKVTLVNKKTGQIEAEGLGSCNTKEKRYIGQNPFNLVNTVLKIAHKRALVSAAISSTISSQIFTQDLEDISEIVQSKPLNSVQPTTNSRIPNKIASEAQLRKLYFITKQMNMDGTTARQLMKDRYGVDSSEKLTSRQASDFIDHLTTLQG